MFCKNKFVFSGVPTVLLGLFICRKPDKSDTFSVQTISKVNGTYKM